jgi:hypothetical protein
VRLETFDTGRSEEGEKSIVEGIAQGGQKLSGPCLLTGRPYVSFLEW